MEPARWQRIEDLLQGALDRDPAERQAFLDQWTQDAPDLRREVEALLAHEGAGRALSLPPFGAAADGPAAVSASLTGQVVGSYRFGPRIGAGGMGEVYEARDERLQRTVAIKVLPAGLARDAERVRRLEEEALAVSRLNHPNVVTLFEVVHGPQGTLLVAEHVPGRTLRELLTDPDTGEAGALPVERALDIAAQVTAALRAAHTAWVIHRDIKPENLMVRSDGLVKVLDFGIAKRGGAAEATAPGLPDAPAGGSRNTTGHLLGTRGYMSPEQLRGEPLDGRTDLYSLGLVLYEMVAGARYFPEGGAAAEARLQRLPGELRALLRKLLQPDRDRRYASANELAADLEALRALASGRTARRMVAAGLLALALAVAVAAVAGWLSVNERWEERVLRDGHTAAARQAEFSPDGRLLVSGGEDGRVIVWDFAKRERLATFGSHAVSRIALSPDGRRFATGGTDGTIVVRDARRFTPTTLRHHRGTIGALAFSPDGRMLVSADGSHDGGRTVLWDTSDWTKIREWRNGASWSSVVFTPSGREALLIQAAAVLRLEPGGAWGPARFANATSASLSPDAERLWTIDPRGEVAVFRFTGGTEPWRPSLVARSRAHLDHGRSIACSPDGRLVASGAEDVVLWDAASHRKLARFTHSAVVWSLAFHPSNRWLVSSHADGALLVWDVHERELVANLSDHSGAIRAVAFSRDGSQIASGSEDRTVVIWDVRTGRRRAVLVGHPSRVTGIAFLPDGGVASVDQDGEAIVWDLARRRPRWRDTPPHYSATYAVAGSPDRRRVATTRGLHDAADGRVLAHFSHAPDWEHGAVYGIAFSPDGRRLALVTETGLLLVLEAATGRRLEHQRVDATLIAVAFSPDGRRLATGEDQGSVRLWSVAPLRQLAELGRHTARVKAVAFSPEGETVASAGDDKRIALWDVDARRLRGTIGVHASPVYSVAFSPDGRRLVSGEHDRSVRLYTLRRSLWGIELD